MTDSVPDKQWRRACVRKGTILSETCLEDTLTRERNMFARVTLAVVVSTMAGTVAFADYYIVQEKTTKQCKIVETLPTETTWLQVGPVAFKSRDEADRQVAVVCKEKMKP
jgi:hypothetical protein